MTLKKTNIMTISIIALSLALVGVFGNSQEVYGPPGPSGGKAHVIEMAAVEMPDDIFAYTMVSHTIDGDDVTADRYGAIPKPSVPGPTLVIREGDTVELTLTNKIPCDNYPDTIDGSRETPSINYVSAHVHGVHYGILSDGTPKIMNMELNEGAQCGGGSYTYEWTAAPGTAGTWPYHDHTFLSHMGGEHVGLLGTLIVEPSSNKVDAQIDGEIGKVNVNQIDKEFILWMVSTETLSRSIFYGMEIDNNNNGRQTPLWVNPNLIATEGEIVRFHVLGLGDEMHSFHIHAHRWLESAGSEHVIDVEEIAPLDRHTFVIRAGEGVGPGDWMYHCHVFEHMEQGMAGMFRVLPSEESDTLPEIGAVFTISDEPGVWFKTLNAGIVDLLDPREGTGFPLDFLGGGFADSEGRSLAVINKGETVLWDMKDSQTKHTVTSIIWPDGATLLNAPFQFDVELTLRGSTFLKDGDGIPVTYDTPGLYVYTCKIHPYMFAGVIVDDDGALPLDLGTDLTVATRTPGPTFPTTVPALDGLITTLVTTFYVVTDPSNWKDYTTGVWEVNHPPVPVTDGISTVTLDALDVGPLAIDTDPPPSGKGIGEVLINTQFERTVDKNDAGTANDKPGTITVVDADTWDIKQKIALPEIDMNHPHNMWTNIENDVIYQTQWFDHRMAEIDRQTGELVKDVRVGESPSHVMTNPEDGKIYIAMNGEEQVTEVDPVTLEISRQISTGTDSHPHGHWISSDGKFIVTPNFFTHTSSVIDTSTDPPTVTNVPVGITPIATGMMPDASKYYTADFLGNTISVVDPSTGMKIDEIDLLAEAGVGLPIQTPVSPDGRFLVTAHVLGPAITVIDTSTDTITATLDCDPGCHGVNWGAKNPDGYYAYVSSKFSNALIVVDPDPDGLGTGVDDGSNAVIAGTVLLEEQFPTKTDDRIIDHVGMGGQGILPIPNVYNGWIQKTVDTCGVVSEDPCSAEIVGYLADLDADQKDPDGP